MSGDRTYNGLADHTRDEGPARTAPGRSPLTTKGKAPKMAHDTVSSIKHQTITTTGAPEGTLSLNRVVTFGVDGTETVTLYSTQAIPTDWTSAYAMVRLHTDGSHCDRGDCGCVTSDNQTKIQDAQSTVVGDWVWSASKTGVVAGWRRTGPSENEQQLLNRLVESEEDLAGEKILHDLTREDRTALIEEFSDRAERLRASIRGFRADYRDMDRLTTRLSCVAVTGWVVAVVLTLVLIAVAL